jgi:N-acetylmuramoyl-L-alanine amidase
LHLRSLNINLNKIRSLTTKFGIDIGHNCHPDTGAVGIKREDDLTKAVGTRLMQKLSAADHSVVNCTSTQASSVGDSLRQRVNKANANQVDIFVSIHLNKADGKAFRTDKPIGTEIFAISNAGKAIAQSVLTEIVKLGFVNRGIKNAEFFVLKHTSMPAILIECCFVDSQADMALFDAEKMADAIKVGLIGDAQDTSESQPGILKVTQKTILKPSTLQSSDLPPETLIDIDLGEYPVLDFRREERHYWLKWPDKSQGDRDVHFVFDE